MTGTDRTVFIVQEPPPVYRHGKTITKDLSSAQRYGRLEPILAPDEQASLTPGPCLHKLCKGLRGFNPTKDYICFAGGDPAGYALALIALRENGIREVSALRWDRERATDGTRTVGGYYVPVAMKLHL